MRSTLSLHEDEMPSCLHCGVNSVGRLTRSLAKSECTNHNAQAQLRRHRIVWSSGGNIVAGRVARRGLLDGRAEAILQAQQSFLINSDKAHQLVAALRSL